MTQRILDTLGPLLGATLLSSALAALRREFQTHHLHTSSNAPATFRCGGLVHTTWPPVRLFAVTTFLAGALLLWSGATPELPQLAGGPAARAGVLADRARGPRPRPGDRRPQPPGADTWCSCETNRFYSRQMEAHS